MPKPEFRHFMPRAVKVLAGGQARSGDVIDTLILTYDQRRLRHGSFVTTKGVAIEIDLAEPGHLRTDDVLVLEDGGLIEVVADAERLLEVRSDPATLARMAWLMGDRHVPVQVFANRLRIRRDAAIEPLLAEFGVKAISLDAPFEPDGGTSHNCSHAHGHQHDDHHCHAHHHDHHDHHHHEAHGNRRHGGDEHE